MTTFEQDLRHQPHLEPIEKPRPIDPAEYTSTTCPVCFQETQQRIRGRFCVPCKGWLIEEYVDGARVHRLWQGRP